MATAGSKNLINTGVLYTDRLKQYLREDRMSEVFPNVAIFSQFAKKLKMGKTKSPDFKLFEYNAEYWNPKVVVSAAMDVALADAAFDDTAVPTFALTNAVATNTNITEGLKFDVFKTADKSYIGQCVIETVAANVSVKWIYIDPDYRDESINALPITLYLIGGASGENSRSPSAYHDEMSLIYNSCNIQKTPLQMSNTIIEAALRGESKELKWERAKKLKAHMIKKEKNYISSRRPAGLFIDPIRGGSAPHITDLTEGTERRSTHGIIPSITDWNAMHLAGDHPWGQSVFQINTGTYGWNTFKEDSRQIFKYSNDQSIKYGFCGDEFLSFFNDLTSGPMGSLTGRVLITKDMDGFEKFKFDVRAFETPFGILKLVRNPLLTLTNDGMHSGKCIIIDPEHCGYVNYRPSRYETSIQENDRDGIKDQYFSDDGIWLGNLMHHHMLELVTE
jgi:hypothetical protein